ncbi:MAG: hypothetical protein H3C57_00930 [Gammaproteobacteria bacterium]|nr:hypothetical protein [Gammaproteobacteria bacterium]
MSRFKIAKRLDAIDARINALVAERRTLEQRLLDGAPSDRDSRRERYFAVADAEGRRRLIGLERELHEKRREQAGVTFSYWSTVSAETRHKLDDLRETSLHSAWQRGIWYDILTILWILVGGGYWIFGWMGALGGALFTAAWMPVLRRGRERTRLSAIRNGEDILHSAENELRLAERGVESCAGDPLFSATEAASGVPDASA